MRPIDSLHWSDDPVQRLGELREAQHHADWMIHQTVKECRKQVLSWAEIGKALGISRQAAWERFHS